VRVEIGFQVAGVDPPPRAETNRWEFVLTEHPTHTLMADTEAPGHIVDFE
jgi:hypothetical protein